MITKPTILVIENAVEPTGSLYSILRSSESLKGQFSFEFILPAEGSAAVTLRNYGFKTWIIPMRELRRDLYSVLLYLPTLCSNAARFRRLLKITPVDLVVNNDFYNLLPTFAAILGSRVPYVCYVRFMPSRFPKLLTRLWFGLHEKFSFRLVAVSEAVKRELPESKKNTFVYNELPNHLVQRASSLRLLILFPANYIKGKGQELALEAFVRILKIHPNWTLRFVGGDMGLSKNKSFKASLMKRVAELNITESVQFLDFSKNLSKHYQESAFVLNFSESESFSLTTLEAQYYGRPVIVTRCGGPEEIVIDGETGILVPVKNVDAMYHAIEYLIAHPERRDKMGELAYHHVRDKFSYANTIGKLANIYIEAIEGS